MDKRTDAKKIAGLFVRECLNNGIPVIEAYLFGSWVKGYSDEYSDIDIALISGSFGNNILDNTRQTAQINYTYPDVEVHHFSPAEFQLSHPFINEIKRTGIRIF